MSSKGLLDIKLSFAISTSPTSFSAISADNWKESLLNMKKLGFAGVELAIRNPLTIDIPDLQSSLRENDLKLVAIGTGQAYVDEGLALSSLDPEIREKALSRMKKHIELASLFQSFVIIGLIRGILTGEEKEREKEISCLVDQLRELSLYAKNKNVKLLIEPLNRYETNIMNTAVEAAAFISRYDLNNCYLLLDTFHMNIEEKEPLKTFSLFSSRIGHIHIADSNRLYPGAGHLDFQQIISAIRKSKYKGYLSGEYKPVPNARTAMRKYIHFMRGVLDGKI